MAKEFGARLLILEDDSSVGNMLRMIAANSGFEAHVVANTERFFEEVDSWQPTHIALDLVMPDMDGVDVLAALGRRHCSANIIITSGMGSRLLDAAKRSASKHGLHVVGVLAKPFAAAALRTLLMASIPSEPSVRTPGARTPVEAPRITEADLRLAIESGQIRVHFQPKISCIHGRLVGFEALARWVHPEQGMIMPDRFVPFAEAHGLIVALTEEVLQQSLAWFGPQLIDDRLGSDTSLSINLSAVSLQDGELLDRVLGCCRRSRVQPKNLVFEVSEKAAMQNPVAALDMLTRMRVQGFELSIDAFGTGFSSMLQLVKMPFSELKVDKSFIMSALSSLESRSVVKVIVELARSLGFKSVAGGVEDAPTLSFLRDMSVDFAQGYFIGRPMDGDAVGGWIAARMAPE